MSDSLDSSSNIEHRTLSEEVLQVDIPEESDDWGILAEEPDEESDQDALLEVLNEVKGLLAIFGVENLNQATRERIEELWYGMDMSPFLVEDLILYTMSDKQKSEKNDLARPTLNDLLEVSQSLTSPYQVRQGLNEQARTGLMKIGYSRFDAYRLPRHGDEDITQAFRVEGWLMCQPPLKDFPEQIKVMIKASREQKIFPSQIFAATKDELARQLRIVNSNEFKANYDSRITYKSDAYNDLKTSVENLYKIANHVFNLHPPRKV